MRNTTDQISTILGTLGRSACNPPEDAIAHSTPEQMREVSLNHLYHIWQAQPGGWKQMLTASEVMTVCSAHQDVLSAIGYRCEPDDALQPATARLAWDRNDSAALNGIIRGVKNVLTVTEERYQRDLALRRAEMQRQQEANLDALTRQFASLPHEQIRELEQLGPRCLELARRL